MRQLAITVYTIHGVDEFTDSLTWIPSEQFQFVVSLSESVSWLHKEEVVIKCAKFFG